MMLKAEMVGPDEDAMVVLAETVVGFILTHGAPKEIRVSNVIIEAILDQVCQVAGIRLRRVKNFRQSASFGKACGKDSKEEVTYGKNRVVRK